MTPYDRPYDRQIWTYDRLRSPLLSPMRPACDRLRPPCVRSPHTPKSDRSSLARAFYPPSYPAALALRSGPKASIKLDTQAAEISQGAKPRCRTAPPESNSIGANLNFGEGLERARHAQHTRNARTVGRRDQISHRTQCHRLFYRHSIEVQASNELSRPQGNRVTSRAVTVSPRPVATAGAHTVPTCQHRQGTIAHFVRVCAFRPSDRKSQEGVFARVATSPLALSQRKTRTRGPSRRRNVKAGEMPGIEAEIDRGVGGWHRNSRPLAIIDLPQIFRGSFQKTCCPPATVITFKNTAAAFPKCSAAPDCPFAGLAGVTGAFSGFVAAYTAVECENASATRAGGGGLDHD
jgi:hypothetical protein